MKMKPEILTVGGKYFNLYQPHESTFGAFEIAHALSHICRFGGHTREFYSVAQHSVIASRIVSQENALAALMHDAAEAFIGDVTAPLKLLLPEYQAIEELIHNAIADRFNLPRELPPEVKAADLVLLATERRDLMPQDDETWALIENVDPLPGQILPLHPQAAYQAFINRFTELWEAGPI